MLHTYAGVSIELLITKPRHTHPRPILLWMAEDDPMTTMKPFSVQGHVPKKELRHFVPSFRAKVPRPLHIVRLQQPVYIRQSVPV